MNSLCSFGYYGGKNNLLKFILPQLDTTHDIFVELFAGSCAVILNKEQVKEEIINDLSGEVIAFWTAVREHPEKLEHAIMNTPAGEAEFNRIVSLPQTDDTVETARRFYVRVTQAYSGIPSVNNQSYMGSVSYKNARKRIGAIANRMRDVTVECRDAVRIIDRIVKARRAQPLKEVLFYCDPPYLKETRSSKERYLEDSFDHEQFLSVVLSAPKYMKFAISGYDSPLYNEALHDWEKESVNVKMHVSHNRIIKDRVECIWRNYPIATQKLL